MILAVWQAGMKNIRPAIAVATRKPEEDIRIRRAN